APSSSSSSSSSENQATVHKSDDCMRSMIPLLSLSETPLSMTQHPDICRIMLNRMISVWQQESSAGEKQTLEQQIKKVIARFQKEGIFLIPDQKSAAKIVVKDGPGECVIQFHEGLLSLSSELFHAAFNAKMKEACDKTFDYRELYSKEIIELFARFVHEGTLPALDRLDREKQLQLLNELLNFAHYIQRQDLLEQVGERIVAVFKNCRIANLVELNLLLAHFTKALELYSKVASCAFELIEQAFGFQIEKRQLCPLKFSIPASNLWLLDVARCEEALEKNGAVEKPPLVAPEATSSIAFSSSSSSSSAVATTKEKDSSFAATAQIITSVLKRLVRGMDCGAASDLDYIGCLEFYQDEPGALISSFTLSRPIAPEEMDAILELLPTACPNITDFSVPFMGRHTQEIPYAGKVWYYYKTDTLTKFLEKIKPLTNLKRVHFSHIGLGGVQLHPIGPDGVQVHPILHATEPFIEALRKAPSLQFSNSFGIEVEQASSWFKNSYGKDVERIIALLSAQRAFQQYNWVVQNYMIPGMPIPAEHWYLMFTKNPDFCLREGGFENGTLQVALDNEYMNNLDKACLEYNCEIELLVNKESEWFVKEYGGDMQRLIEKLKSSKRLAKYAFKDKEQRDYGVK
ncbi:MAG TPA: hypothetical protein VN457_01645, partial [Chlamydiales bacterium]|nr:hypothetical protein [Chlamydiales bacterium]